MGKNRSRIDLIAAILSAANGGSTKTRIMSTANMSYKILQKYLDAAISMDFLQIKNMRYYLTEKGRECLNQYNHVKEREIQIQKAFKELNAEKALLDNMCLKAISTAVKASKSKPTN